MTSTIRTTSMKSALIWLVLLICSLTLAIALLSSNYLDYQRQQQQLQQQLAGLIKIIAIDTQTSLQTNNKLKEEQRLSTLSEVPVIKNVHIYQLNPETKQLKFFASYNRRDTGPWPLQIARVDALTEPVQQQNYIEQVMPVSIDNEILGYVYLRASNKDITEAQQLQLLINLLIAVFSLVVCYVMALKLQQRFTRPIAGLLELVQQVARSKDYKVRAPATELQELNQLNRAFNIMMDRVEGQLHKMELAEQEIMQLNQDLENKINERTSALKASNQELLNTLATLHKYQTQIVETEKMASLGQMVAGIAHEVNTPIGLGVTASTLLQDKVHQIELAFENKTLSSNQLARFLNDSKENLGIIYRNLERAAGLISSFKQVAVDQSNESLRQFNMQQLLNEVLLSLRPHLKKTQHQLMVNCPAELTITSKPGPINQILINLIMNSLIHAFDEGQAGEISIEVKLQEHRCYLSYRDNGKGVPEHIRKRIFDPFVTTRRGNGGSGLGMHLVYNLVTQALNGKIDVQSTLGEGIQILVDFPIGSVSPSKLNK